MGGVVATSSLGRQRCCEGALGGLHEVGNGERGGEREAALGLADVVSPHSFHAHLGDQLSTVVHSEGLTFSLSDQIQTKVDY